ncbi:MAG: TonB C-terminal domain-containing protein [Kofleriaceae bacterium]
MRPVWLLVAMLACGGQTGPRTPALSPSGPPLPAPPPVDASARGATYLTTLSTHVQPAWAQFLEDCRLRLPKTHPLNQPGLVAVAELAIARDGKVDVRIVTGSGNGDYDTAVFDVLGDVSPAPMPPADLVSDDEIAHVHWTFARDGRQAGPASARIVDVQLPLLGVVDRLVARGAVARAALRVATSAIDDPDRIAATEHVMIGALRDGVASSNSAVRRGAIEAIGRAHVQALASEVEKRILPIADGDLRLVAIAAAADLEDPVFVPALTADLATDLAQRPRVAIAKIRTLVAIRRGGEAAKAVSAELSTSTKPSQTGLAALALVPDPKLAGKLPGWFANGDAAIRGAVCSALPSAAPDLAAGLVLRGLRDADAGVRAACTDAAVRGRARVADPNVVKRLRELARDRDRTVRARAIAALGYIEPGHRLRAADDPAPEVRAASVIGAPEPLLRTLVADPDPDVRAAALAALADRAPELVTRATADLAAPVRRVAIAALTDPAILERLAADDSPDVATAALVKLAAHRGRAAMATPLCNSFAAAPVNGPERVRIALAWLLAR